MIHFSIFITILLHIRSITKSIEQSLKNNDKIKNLQISKPHQIQRIKGSKAPLTIDQKFLGHQKKNIVQKKNQFTFDHKELLDS